MLLLEDLSHPKPSYVFVMPAPLSEVKRAWVRRPRTS
jgi:hypothetical protein